MGSAVGSFVGRDAELEAFAACADEGARLLSIVGPPGIGKSRFAVVAVSALRSPGDVLRCDLSAAAGLDDLCGHVASALGVALGADVVAHVGRVIARRDPLLIILDNFEHLVALAPMTVGPWLRLAPRATFVVTSREALRIAGERVLELGPLGMPSSDDVWACEAGTLFVDRARAARPGYVPGAADAAAVREIVLRLEGIPLAIELAAGQAAHLTAAQIAAGVRRSQDDLASDRRDVPARHATLRAAIEASFRLLTDDERDLLAQATVFSGGFTLESAEAVLSARSTPVATILRALRAKSLVRIYAPPSLPGEVRFALYEAVRELASERLVPSAREAVAARHAEHFVTLGEALGDAIDGADGAVFVRRLVLETDNLVAVHARARTSSFAAETALRAALALDPLCAFRGPARLHLGFIEVALDACGTEIAPILRARGLAARAGAERQCGLLDRARADLEAAMGLARGRGRADVEARIAFAQGGVSADLGARGEARVELETALDLARDARDGGLEGLILNTLGVVALLDGSPTAAEDFFHRACVALHAAGNRRWEGLALGNLANLYAETNRADPVALHARAIAIARELECSQTTGQAHASLGAWLHRHGRLADAHAAYDAALRVVRELGDRRLEALVLGNLAMLLHEEGDLRRAAELYEDALAILRAANARHAALMFLVMLAGVLAGLDHITRAEQTFAEAEADPQAQEDAVARGFIALERAHLDLAAARRALAEGDVARAVHARESAIRRIDTAEGRRGGAEAHPALVERWSDAILTVRILRRRMASDPQASAVESRAVIDARNHEVRYGEEVVPLARRAVLRELLYALADSPGEEVSKEVLCRTALGHGYDAHRDANTLRVSMNRLRALLERTGLGVEFARGGYRLSAPRGLVVLRR